MAVDRIEPWGPTHLHRMIAHLIAVTVNMNLPKTETPVEPEDYMPGAKPVPVEEIEIDPTQVQSVIAQAKELARAYQ